eukprot:CAMPEP_0117662704 /NCGR_PEP_ID=MMETSP0804-20121206/8192_1 /TAXON_ID=1074897 /ORGANISM="Tetraselmis astigmatica, Strain CCMP880" /LENGTH=296 /DNA_ID=CAMNT_0005469615 /DNA_START=71 /DNA_END=958 /DNA_ORIENTATION=+
MGIDRTADFWDAVEASTKKLNLPKDAARQLMSERLLRPVRPSSEFGKAATSCGQHIREVLQFLAVNQRDYLQPGRSSALQKDRIEEEVVLFSKACNKQIEVLQEGVMDLRQGGSRRSGVSPQGVAHRQGVVLILTERLAEATAEFDRLRRARFRQASQKKDSRRHAARPAVIPVGEVNYDGRLPAGHPEAAADLSADPKMAMMQAENDALVQELTTTAHQVNQVERAMQDISALNSMFSEQVLRQAEQVEQLYLEAVDASHRVEEGNTSLRKALKLNSSTRIYIILVYCIAIFGVL